MAPLGRGEPEAAREEAGLKERFKDKLAALQKESEHVCYPPHFKYVVPSTLHGLVIRRKLTPDMSSHFAAFVCNKSPAPYLIAPYCVLYLSFRLLFQVRKAHSELLRAHHQRFHRVWGQLLKTG